MPHIEDRVIIVSKAKQICDLQVYEYFINKGEKKWIFG